jgi:DNA-binding helix-hairpin-helix protein with protein kinase domain
LATLTRTVWRGDGAEIWLEPPLGKGGEGTVHAVAQSPDLVAKIYATSPTAERIAKLRAMIALADPDLLRIAAFPVDTVHDTPGGPVVGFLMPRLSGHKELHKLSHPMDRARDFPEVGYDFLIHVGANIARAFAVLHPHGLVVGDVNESSIMVNLDGTVMCIDCDSMQLTAADGRVFSCDVGKPEFQPPEILRGLTTFRGLRRTPSHDVFGLGVVLFQLLMFGWHPFAVRMLTGEQTPIGDNIVSGRFPHTLGFRNADYVRPPHALDTSIFPDYVRDLFERTFVEGRTRPDPIAFSEALERLLGESRPCPRFGTHVHHFQLLRCPFCDLDARLGFPLLPRITLDAAQLRALRDTIARIWFDVSAPPALPEPEPEPPAEVPAEVRADTRRRVVARWLGAASAAAGLALALTVTPALGAVAALALPLALWPRRARPDTVSRLEMERRDRRTALREAEVALAAPVSAAAEQNHAAALAAEARIVTFDTYRQRLLQREHDRLLQGQLDGFLASQRLGHGSLRGLPSAALAALAKAGLRTAADVLALADTASVRGLTDAQLAAVRKWGHTQLTRFTPDLDAADYLEAMGALNLRLDREHAQLVDRLRLARDWLVSNRDALMKLRREQAEALAAAGADAARTAHLDAWLAAGWRIPPAS